jgi:hypothetical protein
MAAPGQVMAGVVDDWRSQLSADDRGTLVQKMYVHLTHFRSITV